MTYSMAHLVETLKKRRLQKGLSQKELGKKLHIPQSHLSKIESGLVDLQTSTLVEMARLLEMEVMIVDRTEVSLIKALQKGESKAPMYQLSEEDYEE